ncbi:cellulase family protein [Ophiostoma piceae UAMH 11346]|uniref:Cellulase family protein n=1 Tax=Ophiostoma piceae (strain UAMH 11346) TaxID=1262450 RepID=S3CAM3_OPHP1|nr:cellulase family protein [Ophiostoma piceae UAMH 11346]
MKFLGIPIVAISLGVSAAAKIAIPLHASSRWILDDNNERVKFRCLNWAGHMEVNLPEGLHRRSIGDLADFIKDQGFNCVRLTYSIDHALNPNVTVANTFTNAASAAGVPLANMTAMYSAAVQKNPFMGHPNTTTSDVYGAVIDTLWDRGIMTLLDNHVSKASWCCDLTDGNGWWDTAFGYLPFNSQYFHTREWLQGLEAMAAWAHASHPGVVAMSLRNELRQVPPQDTNNGNDWYSLISEAGTLVHKTNPDVLVVVGGIDAATDLSTVRLNRMLNTTGWPRKHVWEWHSYSFTITYPKFLPCATLTALYGAMAGFVLTQGKEYTAPLILSEFGVGQSGGSISGGLNSDDSKYLSCLKGYMEGNDGDWALWAIQGSYYVRGGQTDYEETWGLLNHDWTALRNPQVSGLLGSMWNMTQGP